MCISEPKLIASDIAVNSEQIGLRARDSRAYGRYHRAISPDVAKLMKTAHFQSKIKQIIPNQRFASSVRMQVRVHDNGALSIREKGSDRWVEIYHLDDCADPELDEPIDEIIRKTRDAYNGLLPKEDPDEEEAIPLSRERISGTSPTMCSSCHEHRGPTPTLESRDELIRDLREEVRELRREIASLKDERTKTPDKVIVLDHALKEATEKIEAVPDLSPTLLAQNEELRKQQLEIHSLRDDLVQANKDKAALTILLGAASEWNKSLQGQLAEKTESLQFTEEALEAALEEVDSLSSKNQTLTLSLNERTEQLKKMVTLFLATAGMYQQSQKDFTATQKSLEERTNQLKAMTLLFMIAGTAYNASQQELTRLREEWRLEKEALTGGNHELREELETANRKIEELDLLSKGLSSDLKGAREEASRLREELQEAQSGYERELERVNREHRLELQRGVEDREFLVEEHKKAVAELKRNHKQEVDGLTSQVSHLERNLLQARTQLQDQAEAHRQEIQELKQTHKETLRKKDFAHEEALEQLRSENSATVDQLKREHESAILLLKEEHRSGIEELKEQHRLKIQEVSEASALAISQLKLKHAEEIEALKRDHEQQVKELTSQISGLRGDLEKQADAHKREMTQLRSENTSAIDQLEQEHREAISQIEERHSGVIEKLRKQHELALRGQEADHERLTLEFQRRVTQALSEKTSAIEALKKEHALALQSTTESGERALRELKVSHEEEMERLTSQVSELEGRLLRASTKLDEQAEAHRLEIQKLKQSHKEALGQKDEAIDKLERDHESAILALEKEHRLKTQEASEASERAINQLKLKHTEETQALKRDHERQVKELTSQISGLRSDLEKQADAHKREIAQLRSENASAIDLLKQEQREAISQLETRHSSAIEKLQQALLKQSGDHEKLTLELKQAQSEKTSAIEALKKEHALALHNANESAELAVSQLKESHAREIETLKKEIASNKSSFEATLKELVEAKAGVESERDIATKQAETLQKRVTELEEILRDAQTKVKDLPVSMAEDTDEANFPGKYIGTHLDTLLEDNARLKEEMQNLQLAMEEAQERHHKSAKHMEARHLKALREQALQHELSMSELQSEVESGQLEIKRLLAKVSDLNGALIKSKQDIAEATRLRDLAFDDMQGALSKVETHEHTIGRLREKVTDLERTVESQQEELLSENREIVERNKQIEELKRQHRQLEQTIKGLNGDIAELTEHCNYYDNLYQQERRLKIEAEGKASEASDEVARLNTLLKKNEEEYRQHLEEAERTIIHITDKSEKTAASLSDQISDLTETLEAREKELSELREENTLLKKRVEEQDLEIAALRKEATQLRRENKELWSILERIAAVLNVKLDPRHPEALVDQVGELSKTAHVAHKTILGIAHDLGVPTDSLSPTEIVAAIQHRASDLLRMEKEVDLHRSEKVRILKELESLQSAVIVEPPSEQKVSKTTAPTEVPNPLQDAARGISARLGALLRGLGRRPVQLQLSHAQSKCFAFNKEWLLNPDDSNSGMQTKASSMIGQAESKAKIQNHRGFNAIIYQKNTFLDFIDRLDTFLLTHQGEIDKINGFQTEMGRLVLAASRLTQKGTDMSLEELREAQKLSRTIQQMQRDHQRLVQGFFSDLIDAIRLDVGTTTNRFTMQTTTGRGFDQFAKELRAYVLAFANLDESYYVGGDHRNDLIPECSRTQDFRTLVDSIDESLGALFAKVELH